MMDVTIRVKAIRPYAVQCVVRNLFGLGTVLSWQLASLALVTVGIIALVKLFGCIWFQQVNNWCYFLFYLIVIVAGQQWADVRSNGKEQSLWSSLCSCMDFRRIFRVSLITLVFVGNICFLKFFRKLLIIRFIILVSSAIQILHMLVKLAWLSITYRSNFTIHLFYEV